MDQPLPPEAAPAQGVAPAPEGDQGAPQGGGKIAALMSETFSNLATLAELAQSDPHLSAKIQAIKTQFEGLLDDGGQDQGGHPGQGQPVPMEAGTAKVSPVL